MRSSASPMTRQKSLPVSKRRALSLPTSDAAQESPELDEEEESASPGGPGGSKGGDGSSCATFPSTNRSKWVSPVHHDFKTLDFSPADQVSVKTSLAPSSKVRKVLRAGPRIPK